MIVKEDVERLLAADLDTLSSSPAETSKLLGALGGRVDDALTAIASTDVSPAAEVECHDEAARQAQLIERCAGIIAKADTDGRADLATAAQRRHDGAVAAKNAATNLAQAIVDLRAHSETWVQGLTALAASIKERLDNMPAAQAEPAPATPDWEAELAALMAAEGEVSAPTELETKTEDISEILAGLPELVEVADDDIGEAASGTEMVSSSDAAPATTEDGQGTLSVFRRHRWVWIGAGVAVASTATVLLTWFFLL